MIREIAPWYFGIGMFTVILGIVRFQMKKGVSHIDEFTVLSWFLMGWVYLPFFLIKEGINLVKKII